MGIGPFIQLNPFILPPLIAVRAHRKQCVRSWAWTSRDRCSSTIGPSRHPSAEQRIVPPSVAPAAPGYEAKQLLNVLFSFTTKTTCLTDVEPGPVLGLGVWDVPHAEGD